MSNTGHGGFNSPEEPPRYGVRLPQGHGAPGGQPGATEPQEQAGQSAQNPGQYPPPPPASYGQPQQQGGNWGQPQPGWGQYGTPAYGNPGPGGQPPQAPAAAPREITTAFWLIIAAGITSVVATLIDLFLVSGADIAAMFDEMVAQDPAIAEQLDMANIDMAALIELARGVGVVFALIGLGLYLLIAFFIRKGSNGARITGTVLAALSVFGLFSLTTLVPTVLGIAGIVFAWLRPSSDYIRAIGDAKRWRR